jgi:hypothetical protein
MIAKAMKKEAGFVSCKTGADTRREATVRDETWFVSYTTRGGHHKRMTRTFQSEGDAKRFALRMLAAEKLPVAGTLNPYQPKRTISSTQVANWVASN